MENVSAKISQKGLGGAKRGEGRNRDGGGSRRCLESLGGQRSPKQSCSPCKTCCPRAGCFTRSIQHVSVTLFMQDSLAISSEQEDLLMSW